MAQVFSEVALSVAPVVMARPVDALVRSTEAIASVLVVLSLK